ncbi:hypothetical protein BP6252_10708 [Coleophoma cylindrospora]|uniref:Rhamnogalacturonase A/B/Epimerase-like pectate lyase domain-containing protein n=1 Tax=Coleophoma cylindrospora TaxID=1849047 RepID=A0A3D8QTF2_9HELO|nr:hypothetical protein BP6252_10708 [Coleophoma cylindrospora]
MKLFNISGLSLLLSASSAVVADNVRRQYNNGTSNASVFWREAMIHNGRPGYLNSEDAALYSVWRDVRNSTFAGGVVADGVTDDSAAIQAAINFATGEVLYSRSGTAAQTTVPALVYIPGGNYLINSSLQVPVQTIIIGDPLDPPVLIADPSLGQNAIIYVYDSNFGLQPTTQFFQGLRNLVLDTTRVPSNVSGNGINIPGSQASSFSNLHFKMTVGSQHLGIQMYGPNDAGGSALMIGDLSFYGGGTGIRLNNQQFNFKNMTFDSVGTAISVHHVFTATLQGMRFIDCGLGIDLDASDVAGSISLIDSSCSSTNGSKSNGSASIIQTRNSASGDFTLVVDNVKNENCGATVVDVDNGSALLRGSVDGAWVMGPIFGDESSNTTSNQISKAPYANGTSSGGLGNSTLYNSTTVGRYIDFDRSALVTDTNGDYFTLGFPQYEDYDISQVSNVKSDFGAVGDGKTDDTVAIQAALTTNAGKKITFIPSGTYLIKQTVFVPAGSIVVGEVWSVLNAAGPIFSDEANPQPMLRVGNPGDIGVAQFSDMLFSVSGVLPGAVLVEVNMAGESKGDVGFWNSHFRVGGWVGSGNIRQKYTSNCKAAFLMLHLAKTSSTYLENVWGWTADHDMDGGPNMNIATGRGVLIEATKGTWLVGTGFEHNALYQYQLVDAENVFFGMQQVETPYWQGPGSPNPAPNPWSPNSAYFDPTFSNCGTDAQCTMAWAMRIVGGQDIYAYNSAFWVFFNHWAPGNYGSSIAQSAVGQASCGTVEAGTSDLFWFNIDSRACDYIVYDNNRTQTRQVNAPGSWGGAVGAYLA